MAAAIALTAGFYLLALAMVAGLLALELRQLKALAGHDADGLVGVAWDRVGEDVYLVQARAHADRTSAVLTGSSLAELPEALEAAPGVLIDSRDAPREEAAALGIADVRLHEATPAPAAAA